MTTETPAFPTYDGAPETLTGVWNLRRRALSFAPGEALPPADCDLKALLSARVAPEPPPGRGASTHAVKRHEVRRDLEGFSELAALNGLLIAHLRKRRAPRHAAALFRRIWTEESAALLEELPARWLISSAITFGDHGETEGQRRIGLAANVLFSLMKLYEFERLYSGLPADRPFSVARRAAADLPLGMPDFALVSGGLDINLLAPLWQMARAEPVAGPILNRLFERLNEDPRSLFRRIALMRDALQDRRARRSEKRARRAAAQDNPGPDMAESAPSGDNPADTGA
ncbi:hypothetical protein [Pseudogemmobacter humi]|uniref:Uncharacterized protein n=1 Tax=Pseudogemmobacter humi TaxID=2483812 RepID=A0A3P5WZ31_9RHOB|nr:hypothetical protein [Pseudogemmobacter humi]VDC24320.1 hypothetical protein XINFAN_01180 [Pseudogemmobacter humi]